MSSEIWNLHTPMSMADGNWYLPRGRLLIGGGNMGDDFEKGILYQLPSPDAPVIYIPSADAFARSDPWGVGNHKLQEAGFNNIRILYTWSRKEAASAKFVKPLQDAAAVIFRGGEPYRLTETFVGTRFHEELRVYSTEVV